jgi:hypothetical protein
MMVQ